MDYLSKVFQKKKINKERKKRKKTYEETEFHNSIQD